MRGLAGVYASGWLGAGGDRVPAQDDLVAAAGQLSVGVVYTVEPSGFWAGQHSWEVTGGGGDVAPWRWRSGDVTVVSIADDESGYGGPWRGLSPRELVAAFAAFAQLTGVQWADSVGHTAERLILDTHPRERGGTLLDREPVTPAPCESNMETAYTAWRRDLTGAEGRARFVHCFDVNAQYLPAWQSVEIGHGTPTHRHRPVFDRRVAGVWELVGVPPSLTPLLPDVVCEGRSWVSTPTLARLLEVCDGSDAPLVLQAWTWPKRSRFLRAAAERLRDARAAAIFERDHARAEIATVATGTARQATPEMFSRLVVAEAVLEAVKALYTRETGRWLSAATDPRSGWARPDWGLFVIAQARVNLHRRLAQLGAFPFAIGTDALLFASDEPDPAVFAEQLWPALPKRAPFLGAGLGQFTHEGTVEAAALWAEVESGEKLWRAFRLVAQGVAA